VRNFNTAVVVAIIAADISSMAGETGRSSRFLLGSRL
jgi:hypothetical protein